MSTIVTHDTRLEITSFDKIVFTGTFDSLDKAEAFHSWWTQQPTLPQGGLTIARADKPDEWRAAHPLETAALAPEQELLVARWLARPERFETCAACSDTGRIKEPLEGLIGIGCPYCHPALQAI